MTGAGPRVLRPAVLLFLFPAFLSACMGQSGAFFGAGAPGAPAASGTGPAPVSGPVASATSDASAEAGVSTVPASRQGHIAQGKALLAAREPDLAMKSFLRSIATDGLSVEATTGAGIAARQQGLLKESRRYLEQAVRLGPEEPDTHLNLGVVLFQLNEYHAARNEFRAAFALSSGTSDLAATNLNRAEEIVALLEQDPELDPTISHDVVRLGGGHFRLVGAEPDEVEVIAE